MRDKERAKNYNTLYRKQHCIAIAIKNRMYKNLPHIKERRRQQNRLRKDYFKKYYQEHKDYFRTKSSQWVKENPERRRLILKKYAEELRKRRLNAQAKLKRKTKIQRVISDFIEYCKQRYADDTVRQYKINLERFLAYIARAGTHCKEYHARWYKEHKKPPQEQNFSWAKEYHKIRMTHKKST